MSNEFKLVPVEPTEEMCRAGLAERHDDLAKSIYKAMLAAAPQPPALGAELRPHECGGVWPEGDFAKAGGCPKCGPDEPKVEWPNFHDQVMGCGLENRGIRDRYEAMRYGWDEALERCESEVVAPLQAEIERLNSVERSYQLREELLEQLKGERDRMIERTCELSPEVDRLTARTAELERLLREVVALDPRGEFMGWQLDSRIDAALSKPAGGEKV